MWEKILLFCFYTATTGSHAGVWTTHAVACVSVAAPLQATLVRAILALLRADERQFLREMRPSNVHID